MNTQFIVILSIVGALGIGGTLMAIKSSSSRVSRSPQQFSTNNMPINTVDYDRRSSIGVQNDGHVYYPERSSISRTSVNRYITPPGSTRSSYASISSDGGRKTKRKHK